MINASAEFISALQQSSRKFNARLLDNGTELDITIRRLTVYKGSCGPTSFTPGAVYVPYIDATADHYGQSLEGRLLELKIGVMIGGTLADPIYEFIRIGFFTVKNAKTNSKSTTFSAYGRIQTVLADKTFYADVGTTSLSIQDVLDRIEALTGIIVEARDGIDTGAAMSALFFTRAITGEMSCRDALASAAFVAGGYATETADGKIVVCKYKSTVTAEYTAADTMTTPPEVGDADTVITGVQVDAAGGVTYTQGTPVNLKLSSMDMSETAFPAFADNLIGLTYRGGDVALALGDPRLEPWDVMRITDTDNAQYVIPCMYLAIIYDGGLQTRCTAPSVAEPTPISTLDKALAKAREAAAAAADVQARAEAGDFDAVVLRVDSTRGLVFKNNWYNTQLRVTVIKGPKIITDAAALQAEFGTSAYLQWYFRKQADQEWNTMSVSDSHITEGGFCMNVTPDDVDEQIIFQCDLIG